MTERSTYDAFEQRVAGALERYAAAATDPKPAVDIVSVAMQPRGLAVRARNAPRRRRMLLVGLAAAILVPAAYIGAGFRPPAPDRATTVVPSPTPGLEPSLAPVTLSAKALSVIVRRNDGPEPGISIIAVRANGDQSLIRTLNDATLTVGGRFSEWGTVSESGWIALAVEDADGSWPMILLDLRDPTSTPWVILAADIGGVGPRWGPNGLIAALGAGGLGNGDLIIVDPEAHTTRSLPMQGRGLIGGGPSIVWAGDGSGIVGTRGRGVAHDIVPLDGSDPIPGIGQVFDARGAFGPGLATLRICDPGANCPGEDDGRIDLTRPDQSPSQTIWRQVREDRALAASFGRREGQYWLSLDHARGRQVSVVRVLDGREAAIGTFNRGPDWSYVAAPVGAFDESMVVVPVFLDDRMASVLVPRDGTTPSFHQGHFAGFVERTASPSFAAARFAAPPEAMPPVGSVYAMPSVEELIAAELERNPGRRVLASGSHDAVEGDSVVRDVAITRKERGPGDGYLDCFGPTGATVTTGTGVRTSPCLRFGSYGFTIDADGPITVTASGDTTWRVVVYSP